MQIKKALAGLLAVASLIGLTACGTAQASSGNDSNGNKVINVGVVPGPYGDEITEVIAPIAAKQGVTLKLKQFNDYVQPNKALAGGQIEANLFQHPRYLKKFAADNKLDLTNIGAVPTPPMIIYSKKVKTVDEIPNGATATLPNDASNTARALNVLQQNGLIKVKEGIDETKATVNDVAENPKNLQFKTIDAAQLPRSADSADIALVPGNYAWDAKLDFANAVAREKQQEDTINVFVVRTADKDSDWAKTIAKILVSQEFKDAIANSKFKDFGKPVNW